jgi:catechol 2,3-dioxygenase-like lactoylglutathione lyase family enzyme
MKITGINHVTLAVRNLERSLAFYTESLGCRLRARWKRGAYLEAGTLWLCLEVAERVAATTDDSHIALTVDSVALDGVMRWKENRSEGASLNLLDPDGHKLELHVGDLESRLAACRATPYEEMEFFDRVSGDDVHEEAAAQPSGEPNDATLKVWTGCANTTSSAHGQRRLR